MGTVVREGSGLGVVVQTGGRTAFGAIALRLGERQPQTAFQLGLRAFSLLLVSVTAVLAGSILVINVALGRLVAGVGPVRARDRRRADAAAAAGDRHGQPLDRRQAARRAHGDRQAAGRIEDLGNIEVLFTDKTGTLTEGQITFAAALDAERERPPTHVLRPGLLCNDAVLADGRAVGGNQLDRALVGAPDAAPAGAADSGVWTRARSTTSAGSRRCSSRTPTAGARSSSRARPRPCSPAATASSPRRRERARRASSQPAAA